MQQQLSQGVYFLHCDVQDRTIGDSDCMKEGMTAGDVVEVDGGKKGRRMRNAKVRNNMCWSANCQGVAKRPSG
eukprot:13226340-Alexandrium_andersonii.AAC.1